MRVETEGKTLIMHPFVGATPNPPTGQPWWIYLVFLLLSSGTAKFLWETYKDWKNQPSRAVREMASVDASISSVARARDELEADNMRLRQELVDQDARHSRERTRWLEDQERFRTEIARLEDRIRGEQQRYADLLLTVQNMGRQVEKSIQNEPPKE